MSQHQFQLQPFAQEMLPSAALAAFTGLVSRQGSVLHLQYKLQGDLTQLVVPVLADSRQRQDQLWKTTCFEFFLGIPGDPRYWEFNLSPSGDWNCYAFADYRQGMQVEASLEALFPQWLRSSLSDLQPSQDSLGLLLALDLTPLGLAQSSLELSVTAVLEWQDLPIEYFAVQHCGKEPDFHLRESFRLILPISDKIEPL